MADASCSAVASLSAPPSSINGTATKIPHLHRFTSHPRYSVAALLTTPRTSTTQPQGIISDTPQKSVGCLRMRLRLCLRVAKIRTFAPLLVPLRCAGTIALLSDFCSAGWAAHAACMRAHGSRSRTQKYAPSFSHLKEHNLHPLIAFGRYILSIARRPHFFAGRA